MRSGILVARTDSKLAIASSSKPLRALIWPVSQLMTQGAAGFLCLAAFSSAARASGIRPSFW